MLLLSTSTLRVLQQSPQIGLDTELVSGVFEECAVAVKEYGLRTFEVRKLRYISEPDTHVHVVLGTHDGSNYHLICVWFPKTRRYFSAETFVNSQVFVELLNMSRDDWEKSTVTSLAFFWWFVIGLLCGGIAIYGMWLAQATFPDKTFWDAWPVFFLMFIMWFFLGSPLADQIAKAHMKSRRNGLVGSAFAYAIEDATRRIKPA